MSKMYIGIDPAFRQSGFAVCIIDDDNATANFIIFKNGLVDFMFWVMQVSEQTAQGTNFVGVENSNLQDDTFDKGGNKYVTAKKSRDVGKNMATSQNVMDICRVLFGENYVFELSPAQKGAKIKDDKIFRAIANQEKLELLNYKGIISEQDKRDAFMMAVKTRAHFRLLEKRMK